MNNPKPPIQDEVSIRSLGWVAYFSNLFRYINGLPLSGQSLPNYVDDAAAAAGGVPLHGYYRNGSIVMQRVA